MRELGRRGAAATRRKWSAKGLASDELPPLRSPEAAERWAEIVGRAVAEKRLSHAEGRAIGSLVREFLKAHADGTMAKRLEALQTELDEVKKRGGTK
jgi:hypothetical protein